MPDVFSDKRDLIILADGRFGDEKFPSGLPRITAGKRMPLNVRTRPSIDPGHSW